MNLKQILEVPDTQRDLRWEAQFFNAFTGSNVNLLFEEPQYGPDSWPYLLVETQAETTEGEEPVQNILRWLSDRGIGLVVNPRKEFPDYVFSYGMIWSFRESGLFYKEVSNSGKQGTVQFKPSQIAHAGSPTEEYLPIYVRSIIKQFLQEQGVLNPKILVLSMDKENYDLAFSLESLGNPDESEHAGIAEALSWFLPPHYSILLVSEKGLPPFTEL